MSDLDRRLREVFADAFDTTPEEIDTSITTENSADWDSMRSIVLATSIEGEFDIEFTDEELVDLDSYEKIRTALIGKGIAP